MKGIDKATRFTNYLIDIVIITSLWIVLIIAFESSYYISVIGYYLLMFLYYFIFEIIKGQTIGKMITKTRVVDFQGQPPGIIKLFLRTIARMIPVDGISYLFGTEIGFHDSISSTKLVKTSI